jgi:hypothetical protein
MFEIVICVACMVIIYVAVVKLSDSLSMMNEEYDDEDGEDN